MNSPTSASNPMATPSTPQTLPAGAKSPSSSPRLPSPPPMPEDQSAPRSPTASPDEKQRRAPGSIGRAIGTPHTNDKDASRRIRPGTKSYDMHEGPPVVELSDIDSAFQLTEHLKSLHYEHTHPPTSSTIQPITPKTAISLSLVPPDTDPLLWLHELCRFLVQHINLVIVGLFSDTPACSAQTCGEMRASEWQYLCAVHDPPKSCCAIDYSCHTLDWAANTLTGQAHFPSRLAAAGGGAGGESGKPENQQGSQSTSQSITRAHQERQLTNIFRRVYRIFAHAWFSHQDIFWRIEQKHGLYVFFKTVCDEYNLIEKDNYTIPPEAEALHRDTTGSSHQGEGSAEASERGGNADDLPPVPIIKREDTLKASDHSGSDMAGGVESGTAVRRSRHSSSKSGSVVHTVIEENEDENEGVPAVPQVPRHLQSHTWSSSIALPIRSPQSAPQSQSTEDEPGKDMDVSAMWMKGDIEQAQRMAMGEDDGTAQVSVEEKGITEEGDDDAADKSLSSSPPKGEGLQEVPQADDAPAGVA